MKIEPKRRGWKEGVLTEELRSLGGTHKKGAVVRYKKHRLREIKESWDCKKQVFVARTLRWEGKYEWHYLDQQNLNLIRSTRFLIEEEVK